MSKQAIVIGAGISGLTAASRLGRRGWHVRVLEKSRGLGGRAATRRRDNLAIDHGAQFFTARSESFRAQVDAWTAGGVCHEWARGFHQYRGGRLQEPGSESYPRYACRDGMSSLGRAVAAEGACTIERETKVVEIRRIGGTWHVASEDGRVFQSAALIVTCPPPQGADLLHESEPEASALLRDLRMEPCLAVAACFPRRKIPWHGIQCDDEKISWIGHDTSKRPDLHEAKTVVVIHAAPDFSRVRYQDEDSAVIEALTKRASDICAEEVRRPESVFLHRWRYAQPVSTTQGKAALLFEGAAPLVLAGECFAGGKIEGAWLSGAAAAQMLTDN